MLLKHSTTASATLSALQATTRRLAAAQPPRRAFSIGFALGIATFATMAVGPFVGSIERALDADAADYGITQVSIAGHTATREDDIFAALHIDNGTSILTYDLRAAEARIAALPGVASARVDRQLPDQLAVTITERSQTRIAPTAP